MGSQLFLLSLLLITCIQQVQGNQKTERDEDTSLKLSKDGSDNGKPVISGDLGTITNVPGRLCKCEENGRWEENELCLCAKSARHKNRRVKLRKLCKTQKNIKKCHLYKKKQRKHTPTAL